jgi:uncharacterized protein (TIGR02246 family)
MRATLKIFSMAVLLSVGACAPHLHEGPPGPPPAAYGPAAEHQIEQAKDRYSAYLLAMDADGVASMYAPDGVMERQSGGPLRGRDEIRAFLSSSSNVKVLSVQMTTISFSYDGPAVVQTGEFHQTARANGKVVNAAGRFEATWIRGPHGDWFVRHMATRPIAGS